MAGVGGVFGDRSYGDRGYSLNCYTDGLFGYYSVESVVVIGCVVDNALGAIGINHGVASLNTVSMTDLKFVKVIKKKLITQHCKRGELIRKLGRPNEREVKKFMILILV